MRIYTVHQRPYWQVNEDEAADQSIVLVREGFNWFVLVFPLFWALWHRLWLIALVIAVVAAAINLAVTLLGVADLYVSLLSSAILIWVGFEANDLRRWSLRRSGWRDLGIISGRTRNEAEWRFFLTGARQCRHKPRYSDDSAEGMWFDATSGHRRLRFR